MSWTDPTHKPECRCEDCVPVRVDSDLGEWRLRVLLGAGYGDVEADLLASSSVDLHEACDLVAVRGCPPAAAVKILL